MNDLSVVIPVAIVAFGAPTIFFGLALASANARNRRLSGHVKQYQGMLDQLNGACDTYKAANQTLSDALGAKRKQP